MRVILNIWRRLFGDRVGGFSAAVLENALLEPPKAGKVWCRRCEQVTSFKGFALVTAICGFFASVALYAQFNAGFYAAGGTGSIRQTIPSAVNAGASYEIAAYLLYPAASFRRRRRAGSCVLLQYVSQPSVYHHAASFGGRCLDRRGEQNGESLWGFDSR